MARLFASLAEETITVRYTTSQVINIPAGVTRIDRLSGRGAAGTDGTSGYYDPPVDMSTYAAAVVGYNNPIGPSGFPGTISWSTVQSPHQQAVSKLNNGGSGTWTRVNYHQYTDGFVIENETMYYGNVIPGSAFARFTGWKTSGNVQYPDFGFSYVDWQEYGAYNPGTPPTTGASASVNFGQLYTFPGSTGSGSPTAVSYTNVPVTPGNYTLSIPFGGYIEITYTK